MCVCVCVSCRWAAVRTMFTHTLQPLWSELWCRAAEKHTLGLQWYFIWPGGLSFFRTHTYKHTHQSTWMLVHVAASFDTWWSPVSQTDHRYKNYRPTPPSWKLSVCSLSGVNTPSPRSIAECHQEVALPLRKRLYSTAWEMCGLWTFSEVTNLNAH